MTPAADDHPRYPDAAFESPGGLPTPDRLMETATAFWQSAVLLSADELGVFAELTAGPCNAAALARRLDLCADAVVDLLDALAVLNLVQRSEGSYRPTPEASRFLDPASPTYLGPWLAMSRAAMRDLAELTCRLRAEDTVLPGRSPLTDRMWADITRILEGSGAHDDA